MKGENKKESSYSQLVVGVLALQGDFEKHIQKLCALGVKAKEIRKPEELEECAGLIIPGGESTTMLRQIEFIQFRQKLESFADQKPIFGTCAGLILMSREILGYPLLPFCLLDVSVERNAFGRQAESFEKEVEIQMGRQKSKMIPAIFIRAPRIRSCGSSVKVLGRLEDEPILIQQGHHLGATFHPELTSDDAIHHYFIEMILNTKKSR